MMDDATEGPAMLSCFAAGALAVNSLPHLATAAAGKQMLTPLAGRGSGAAVNLVWGAANLTGGLLLARRTAGQGERWDGRFVAFSSGALAFAAWMAITEAVSRTNSDGSAMGAGTRRR